MFIAAVFRRLVCGLARCALLLACKPYAASNALVLNATAARLIDREIPVDPDHRDLARTIFQDGDIVLDVSYEDAAAAVLLDLHAAADPLDAYFTRTVIADRDTASDIGDTNLARAI